MSTSSDNVKMRWKRQDRERAWAGKMVGKSHTELCVKELHVKDVLHVEDI